MSTPRTDTNASTASPSVDSSNTNESQPATAPEGGYPEQKHAGKVGYGPNYRAGAGFNDKVSGMMEEMKGKATHNPERVQHGHDVYSGAQKRKELLGEGEESPFQKVDEEKPKDEQAADSKAQATPAGGAHTSGVGAKEQAATIAPQGTHSGEMQRKGEAVDRVKHIG
ncbi:hypothetical protein BDQ12DRAFT_750814 [Crucibulum laeve]|uniref:Uncharacterized protein n=1 Tax=Crucibulum laeve TaxID=68775 RepID=A0A5C3LZ50_9AGAR|nr:hypothetical protein BDQ12DRAFT_750814 [Crucibulum laeve]